MAANGPPSPDQASTTAAATSAAIATVETNMAKVDEPSLKTHAATPASIPPPLSPSYTFTKNSDAYAAAKDKLKEGDFEGVLEIVETALGTVLSTLQMHGEDEVELHPSVAPLHYMYGTALLYSVEESDDNPENQVMVGQSESQKEEAQDQNDEGGAEFDKDAPPQDAGPTPAAAPTSGADTDGDLQIAWENLETARSILARITSDADIDLVAASASATSESDGKRAAAHVVRAGKSEEGTAPESMEELTDRVLDLAQIHARLGDLQKANGKYLDACDDYGRALDMRTRILGRYHRKVADGNFCLASALLLAAAEGEKGLEEGGSPGGGATVARGLPPALAAMASAGSGNDDDGGRKLTREEIEGFRTKSMEHHIECGRAFGGLIAELCGADPVTITADVDETDGDAKPSTAAATTAASSSITDRFSSTLAAIRQRVANLPPPCDPSSANAVDDAREVLDDLQEAVDAFEGEKKALRSVQDMKARAEAAANAEDDEKAKADEAKGGGDEGEGVTTIGFGAPTGGLSTSAVSSTASNKVTGEPTKVSASSESSMPKMEAATKAAPAMMVVKKKKKRAALEPVATATVTEMPAEGGDTKRTKVE